MEQKTTKTTFIDRLPGDKVVWIIILFLCFISLVSIFSSTSQLATEGNTRLDIVQDQLKTIVMGLGLIIICLMFNSIEFFRKVSSIGFITSFALLLALLLLRTEDKTAFIRAASINGAWRILVIKGLQIHVFEIVKVAMVMYLAWAIDKSRNSSFKILDILSEIPKLEFLAKKNWQQFFFIMLPTLLICGLSLPGGNSNTLFISILMFATMFLGQVNIKMIALTGVGVIMLLAACFGIYKVTSAAHQKDETKKVLFSRIGTAVSRITDSGTDYEELFLDAEPRSQEYYNILDKLRQPYGAKIAIQEGGLFGKGPGNSTQKYVVPVIYEDYIFSFIIEEYGVLIGGLILIALYISLLARGSIIVRNCNDYYAKVTVTGLCILITGQAMMHIIVNCDIGLLTGQTLPLVSYGTTAFLCFSIAFGIILSISRIATTRIEKDRLKTIKDSPLLDLSQTRHESMESRDIIDSTDNE